MRLRWRDTTALAVGSAANGLLAYVFFALATRHLGAEDAAAVSVLWTYWSFASAALTFPLQHWIARSVAAHRGEGAVAAAMPRIWLLVLTVAALATLLAWVGREPLFVSGAPWFPLLVGAVTVGSGFLGVVRGALAARHEFVTNASILAAENGLRCAAAAVLVGLGVGVNVWFGVALAAGAIVGLSRPSTLRFHGGPPAPPATREIRESPLAFLGGAAGGQLLGQSVLTGGPVVLALAGGTPAQVTALFAGLALFRAPYTFAIGLVAQVTGRLTVLVVEGDRNALRRVRLAVVGLAVAATLVAVGIAASVGPALIRLVFGSDVVLGVGTTTLVAVGSALALTNLVSTLMVLAQNRAHAVARAWAVALVTGGLGFAALAALPPLDRTVWAFVVAESTALVTLLVEEGRGVGRVVPEPGSPSVRPQ
jgi:O-antigen/teichoic acid export membrane protein